MLIAQWKACKFIPSYVFTRLSPSEVQLLLEEVDADLVAAGEDNPGPGSQWPGCSVLTIRDKAAGAVTAVITCRGLI